ncbi:multicopper oxidase family protein [Candidatus Methylocalor cossyra]|uniref:Multicopper oxidase CueO n=1 Tax=Candidatus Methylocalor cossyra TaxID=3108543 RepID=A0ABP1C952_9GAMM
MQNSVNRSRRRWVQGGLGLAALVALPGWARAIAKAGMGSKQPPQRANPKFKPDVEIDLLGQYGSAAILPGEPTRVLRYTATLVKGPTGTLAELPGSYLGPLIRLQQGQRVRVNFSHRLAEPAIVHWHGLHVPSAMDGHAMSVIERGETFVYEFEIRNRAGLYIYHPHPHGLLGRQLYYGLAGGLIVRDQEEARLDLPGGEFELPLVIQDRRFDRHNQLVYASTMHDRLWGFYGDRILVNGRPTPRLEVASRAYRLRLINGSNARIYKLGWSDGTPVTVIGVDGGLLETPETLPYAMLGPGERLDLWADFSGRGKGSEVTLRSLSFRGALPRMGERMMGGMGMMGTQALPVGGDFPICTVRVTRETSDSPKLPTRLAALERYTLDRVANRHRPVPIAISEAPMAMLLNGRPYRFDDVQPFERIPVDTFQLLEIFHAHGADAVSPSGRMGCGPMGGMGRMGGMGMAGMFRMAHPIHLHGQPFQIISRSIDPGAAEDYATVKDGLVDSGLKDTVLVMPGEKVRLIKPFQDFKGLFMYHCHNIEHEDMGMMRDFLVE